MTKIKLYPIDTNITDDDIVIGSDADNSDITKNYQMSAIRSYIANGLSPEIGGTLKITELVDVDLNETPEDFINSLSPAVTIASYEVVIVVLTSSKYILKLQDVVVGNGETPTTASDFILITDSFTGTVDYVAKFTPDGTQIGDSQIYDNGLNVSIGSATPPVTSLLNLTSTTKGFLQPRMTTTQRNAISAPAEGLRIYNTTTKKENFYNGTIWVEIQNDAVNGTLNKLAKFTPDGTHVGDSAITDNSTLVEVDKPIYVNGNSTTDSPLGPELLTSSNWTSTGWTGNFTTGFIHTTGNTSVLSNTIAATVGSYYQISYTITARTAGYVHISFGGQSKFYVTSSGAFGPKASTTGNLTITPDTNFDGTVVLSIKQINSSYALLTLNNSTSDTNYMEFRVGSGDLRSIAIGSDAGRRITTGGFNSIVGHSAGANLTSGTNNTLIGYNTGNVVSVGSNNTLLGGGAGQVNISSDGGNTLVGSYAGLTNVTGSQNTFVGFNSGGSCVSGFYNTLIGASTGSEVSGNYNTAVGNGAISRLVNGGDNNIAFGVDAGRNYLSGGGGSFGVESATGSVFLGAETKPLGDAQTNQIVIGYDAVGAGNNTATLGNEDIVKTVLRGTINAAGLPTSAAGLSAGDIWNNGGVLNIV
jgi:hypothetical protein